METFTRDDGARLAVVPGFRERTLSYRQPVTPREHWTETDYRVAAAKKRRRSCRLAQQFCDVAGPLDGKRVLDVGCGDGSNAVLLAEHGASVHGIDLALPILDAGEHGERLRRVGALMVADRTQLSVTLELMDATAMTFGDATFDLVMSRSAMEHLHPVERALAEMVRVTRPGGVIHCSIDPFFWLRGCHKQGVVDIPFAHARLSLDEFTRFVTATEGERAAARRRQRLATLNRLTLAQWREVVSRTGCEVLAWQQDHSAVGAAALAEFPEVAVTLRDGVTRDDLLHERIRVWLRKPE
jgi:SAM-dependent methyltransferase